jgi:hypothetical protein
LNEVRKTEIGLKLIYKADIIKMDQNEFGSMYSTIGSGTPSQATCGSSHNLEEVGFEMTISKRLPPEALTARPQNNIMIKIIELNQSIQINKYAITIHASSAAKRLLPFIFYSLSHGCTTKIPSNLG